MNIIDFRIRPLYKHYLSFGESGVRRTLKAFGHGESESVRKRSVEPLIRELDEAGVVKGVIPGRIRFGTTNEELFEIADLYPERFIIYPFLDMSDPQQALRDVDTYIINGKGRGASIEPYVDGKSCYIDESFFPVYEKLQKNNIPLMSTVSGWVGSYINNTIPAQIDTVLTEFPDLKFIAGHSGWPWFGEMVALTFKHPNLYLTADFEGTRGAGADILRQGAYDYLDGGCGAEDAVLAAVAFEKAGVDIIDISGGLCGYTINGREKEQGYFSEVSEVVRKAVSIPVILTGGITDINAAEKLLTDKKADLIGVGRAVLKDSKWAEKALKTI